MRKILLGAAAAAMVFGGGIAHAAPAANNVRSGSVVGDAESLNGTEIVALLVGAAALVFALVSINDSDDSDDLPVSP